MAALLTSIVAVLVSDCTKWLPPKNIADYPKWIYCNRRPGDGQTAYTYMETKMPPADVAPYQCTNGRVLRHDAAGIICADYTKGDEYAGPCTDAQCCAEGICSSYSCTVGSLKSNAADISCAYFPCNDYTCCDNPSGTPKHDAQGLIFVDRDPKRFQFGGKATIIRAPDESDITHYRIYWGFAKTVRKVPSCGLKNPVSWEQFKFTDLTRMYGEYPATGCDITFDIPMGTLPNVRCTISYDRKDKTIAANDPCNPHYLIIVSMNANGMKFIDGQVQQLGPRHPISDYEDEFGLPCAEGGVTMGHDLPGPDDVILGTFNGVNTAKECAQLCRDYTGSKGPCRYWTFAYPTGGHTEKSCWMEAQVLQKAHYGVRIIGPAVCPTPDDAPPTGIERPRCNRWVRIPNMAPFDDSNRGAYTDKGGIYNQKPNIPDVPLGQYSNAEECQAICDMDVLCIGFVYMKKDVTDTYFHKCIMIHITDTLRSTPYYDLWMCSREGMAPLINGYEMQTNPFGYKTCEASGVLGAREAVPDQDCCAEKCTADSSCVAFTFYNTDKTCQLFSACSTLTSVNKVTGCAYESCFDTYGLTTYKKLGASMELVDRWPKTGSESGIETYVQTAGIEGRTVHCYTFPAGTSGAKPQNAEDMISDLAADRRFSAVVTVGVASMTILKDMKGKIISPATEYTTRCGVENAVSLGLTGIVSMVFDTEYPYGYVEITANNGANGWCRGDNDCIKGSVAPNKPYTISECKALCDAQSNCLAFQIRSTDGNCGLATQCVYNTVKADTLVKCFKKSNTNVHTIGNDKCEKKCDGTCYWERRMGLYTRNRFLAHTANSCQATDAPDTPAPDTLTPDTTAPATPAPDTTSPVTPAPDTPAPDTPAPDTPVPDTTAPDTPAPDTPAPDTPAPDTPAPDTPAPDTPAPDTQAPPTLIPGVPATPAPDTAVPTAAPATSAPDTQAPATPAPDTSAPDTSAPDTPAPDTQAPATPAPDTSAPDTSAPDTPAPDTQAPATPAPDTSSPDTSAPDTSAPDTSAPDTSAPDTLPPATLTPGIPATPAPATAVPTAAPQTSAPDTSAPDTLPPATLTPGIPATPAPATAVPTAAPKTSAPDTAAPATLAPNTLAPATWTPGVPTTTAPATAVPTVAPKTSAPDTAAPATLAPDTPAPATWTPGVPTTTAPATAEPTTAPATAEPTTAPATDAPLTPVPATDPPSTGQPTSAPTPTQAPATTAPATWTPGVPTTPAPATAVPTTAPSTSSPPTWVPGVPTTSAPDTAVPTTAPATPAPITWAPGVPKTSSPETEAPATLSPATGAPNTTVPGTTAPGATSSPGGGGNGTNEPDVEDPEDNGSGSSKLWIWIIVGTGSCMLLIGAALVVRHKQQDSVPLSDFSELMAEGEFMQPSVQEENTTSEVMQI